MNKSIIICSKNKAKNKAVQNVMSQFFKDFTINSLETKSGVSETPVDDNEGILGCHNRIKSALEQENTADLYVAMEGILTTTNYGTFLCGWTVIYNRPENEFYYGCSAKVKVPDEIIANTSKNQRLSEVVAEYVGSTDAEISKLGTNGMLTGGVYTRTNEFVDSVMCAMSSKYKKLIWN